MRLEPKTASPNCSSTVGHFTDHLPEASLLQDLPRHPNIVSALYHCRGHTEKFREHIAQHIAPMFRAHPDPTTALCSESHSGTTECPYDNTTHAPANTGSFLFQSIPGVSLRKYFQDFLRTEKRDAAIEERFLHILAQLLLAVAHLQRNLVSHCAISSRNVYVSDRGQKVVLGDFGQALSLRPKNLDVLQQSIKRLKTSKMRKLSPEAEHSLTTATADDYSTHTLHDLEESFRLSDSYAVGVLFYDLLGNKSSRPLSENTDTPFIHSLSFRCNHLLQKLVARNPSDRFSALQGAMSCFVYFSAPGPLRYTTPRNAYVGSFRSP